MCTGDDRVWLSRIRDPEEPQYTKNVNAHSGERIMWRIRERQINGVLVDHAFIGIILKLEQNIIGYVVIEADTIRSTRLPLFILKSVLFPQAEGKYQNVSEEYVKTAIEKVKNEKKTSIDDPEGDDLRENEGNDTNISWIQIVEATLAEVSKANANYKISASNNYETIVDGNKMVGINGPQVMEGEQRYTFTSISNVWYKTLGTGGWTPSATMGEWAAFSSIGSLSVLFETISNYQNVEDLGNGKYSYHQNGMGPDPDTYIFTATEGLISRMEVTAYGGSGILMYRTSVSTYTYGGQTVTLPTEFILTVKLMPPKNLNINNGILTWDEVEGVGYYSGDIYKDGNPQLHFYRIDFTELNFHEHAFSLNWTSGTYQITIRAIHPTTHMDYMSGQTSIEYIYNK
jgi:hypothetical protein